MSPNTDAEAEYLCQFEIRSGARSVITRWKGMPHPKRKEPAVFMLAFGLGVAAGLGLALLLSGLRAEIED